MGLRRCFPLAPEALTESHADTDGLADAETLPVLLPVSEALTESHADTDGLVVVLALIVTLRVVFFVALAVLSLLAVKRVVVETFGVRERDAQVEPDAVVVVDAEALAL